MLVTRKCQICRGNSIRYRCEFCEKLMPRMHDCDTDHKQPSVDGQERRIEIYQAAARNEMPLFEGPVAALVERTRACAGKIA